MTDIPECNDRLARAGRAIKAFVNSPVTNLVKGLLLVFIGLSEASHTLREDLETMHLRVGHGLFIIGLFSVLDTLPHFIEGIEASRKYLESKGEKGQSTHETDRP
jgi:hypothetical protein